MKARILVISKMLIHWLDRLKVLEVAAFFDLQHYEDHVALRDSDPEEANTVDKLVFF